MRDVDLSYLQRQPSSAVIHGGAGCSPCKTGFSPPPSEMGDCFWMWLCGPETQPLRPVGEEKYRWRGQVQGQRDCSGSRKKTKSGLDQVGMHEQCLWPEGWVQHCIPGIF